MTAYVLISGSLFREPEQRISKAGKPFVTATIRAKDGNSSECWKVLAFPESVQAELMEASRSLWNASATRGWRSAICTFRPWRFALGYRVGSDYRACPKPKSHSLFDGFPCRFDCTARVAVSLKKTEECGQGFDSSFPVQLLEHIRQSLGIAFGFCKGQGVVFGHGVSSQSKPQSMYTSLRAFSPVKRRARVPVR